MEDKQSYWSENLRLIFISLVIWFVVSFGFGLLLVEPLNEIRLGGYKLETRTDSMEVIPPTLKTRVNTRSCLLIVL